MDDSRLIWRLGRWVAMRKPGRARLSTSEVAFEVNLDGGLIVGISGIDTSLLGRALTFNPLGETDLVEEALALAAANDIPETTVMGAAKVILQDHLRTWFLDPERQLELIETPLAIQRENSISATHAIVEMVLSDPDGTTTAVVLPTLDVLLRRAEGFLDLYAPLGLAEEADLIVAKITGQRTAGEIASRSPQHHDDVVKLLAALTASGMLEAVHAAVPEKAPILVADPEPRVDLDRGRAIRRLPPLIILAAIVGIAAVVVTIWWFMFQNPPIEPVDVSTGHWAIAVDLGCEPHEYRRLLEVARRHDDVRPIALTPDGETGEETCWRLVWGDFPRETSAEEAIQSIPKGIRREGFEPHVVEVPEPEVEEDTDGGG